MENIIKNKPMLIILSAPSGAGKTSIAKILLEKDKNLSLSISTTTRKKRPGEKEGVDYFFKKPSEFEEMIKAEQLLEFATIYENFYGTPRNYVEEKLLMGQDVLFDIDSQGAYKLIEQMPDRAVSIFITVSDIEILRDRLISRGQDDQETINYRMNCAKDEMLHAKNYDYVVINDDFNQAVKEVQQIIVSERAKRR